MISKRAYNGTITPFSAFQVNSDKEFDFSPEDYSKFKHGAINIARKFGYMLADKFIKECFEPTYDGKPIVVVPSAHSHIPTASCFMMRFFKDRLNDYLYMHNHPVVEETKIHRTVTYREDYGEMSADDRYKLIKGDKFYIDKEFIGNKTLIFLDDIKITGTHEQIIVNMLNDYKIKNDCYMLYFAELVNSEIPPKIENYLNNYSVNGIDDIAKIISEEEFQFNTRVVKYILNREAADFDRFISQQGHGFVSELYYNAIGNEYYKFSSYLRNLNELRTIVLNINS